MPANRFSIYDAMERAGKFSTNPANADARDKVTGENLYKGPVPYPKMMYHPEGEEAITTPAEIITTPMGPKEVGEQRQLISQVVESLAEEEALRAEGWHDHPAKAIRARVELLIAANPEMGEKEKKKLLAKIPPISSDTRIKDLEVELKRITAERDAERLARGTQAEPPKASAKAAAKPATTQPSA